MDVVQVPQYTEESAVYGGMKHHKELKDDGRNLLVAMKGGDQVG